MITGGAMNTSSPTCVVAADVTARPQHDGVKFSDTNIAILEKIDFSGFFPPPYTKC